MGSFSIPRSSAAGGDGEGEGLEEWVEVEEGGKALPFSNGGDEGRN